MIYDRKKIREIYQTPGKTCISGARYGLAFLDDVNKAVDKKKQHANHLIASF